MAIIYLDSGVLIEACHEKGELSAKALQLLDNPDVEFASSDWVRLEVLGQPRFHGRDPEVEFYEGYFKTAHHWPEQQSLKHWTDLALAEMRQYGLKPLDSLHVVAASLCKADRLITSERRMKSMHRTKTVKVVSLNDA
jgi:predicted nucleic acid-binding protein